MGRIAIESAFSSVISKTRASIILKNEPFNSILTQLKVNHYQTTLQVQVNFFHPNNQYKTALQGETFFLSSSIINNLHPDCYYTHLLSPYPSTTHSLPSITQAKQSLPAKMDPAVKTPDLAVQGPKHLSTIYESQTENASETTVTVTAPEVTEASTGQTTTRGAPVPETPSSTTTSQAPAAKAQTEEEEVQEGQAQAQVQAVQTSGFSLLFDLTGKVIIVTGGARGLGFSMSQSLIECGATGASLPHTPFPTSHPTIPTDILQSTPSTSSPPPAPSSTASPPPFPQED